MASGKTKLLMVAVKDEDSSAIINSAPLRQQAVTHIANAVNAGLSDGKLMFDGVVVDFEGLKGIESQNNYNDFLTRLKQALNAEKLIYAAVQPQRRAGHEYYDGYDYKTIGNIADKVILMAHDYNPKVLTGEEMTQGIVMTPVAPIDEVYYALKAVTDKTTGVQNPDKILLQFSFGTAQWKLKDGAVLNEKPYTPEYDAVVSRIQSGAAQKYSTLYESPYITFLNTDDGTDNVLWYEDTRSINAKMQLALLFGIHDVSLWRLGTIPDYDGSIHLDVMSNVLAW